MKNTDAKKQQALPSAKRFLFQHTIKTKLPWARMCPPINHVIVTSGKLRLQVRRIAATFAVGTTRADSDYDTITILCTRCCTRGK